MIGMSFGSFLTLLILGLIAAAVLHYAARYRALSGVDGFFWKWIAGWVGAWLGSPVLGHWGFRIANVYVIPAIIAAFTGAFLVTALVKANTVAMATIPDRIATAQSAQFEVRKAG